MIKVVLHDYLINEHKHLKPESDIPHFSGMSVGDIIKGLDIQYDILGLIVLDGLSVTSEAKVGDNSKVEFYPSFTLG